MCFNHAFAGFFRFRCHRCHDWRYLRCPDCGRCSLGVGSGLSMCEHCGHAEAHTPVSASSVASASDLFNEDDGEEEEEEERRVG